MTEEALEETLRKKNEIFGGKRCVQIRPLCVCACVYICTYIYIYVYVYVYICVCVRVCIYVHIYTYIYIRPVYAFWRMICIYVYIHIYTYQTCMYIYLYIKTCICFLAGNDASEEASSDVPSAVCFFKKKTQI